MENYITEIETLLEMNGYKLDFEAEFVQRGDFKYQLHYYFVTVPERDKNIPYPSIQIDNQNSKDKEVKVNISTFSVGSLDTDEIDILLDRYQKASEFAKKVKEIVVEKKKDRYK